TLSQIVKAISNTFSKVELSSNDLLLSEILNVEALDTSSSPIKKALQEIMLWNSVKETLLPKLLPNGLKNFIINQVRAGNALIPNDGDRLLLWRIPILQSCSTKFNESSWAHYVLQPIVNFVVDFKESDICIRWDTIISKASLERNNKKGPVKKNNIYGVYESRGHFDLELMLGEISNETVLELFIIDRRIVPLYRMRRLGIVEIPFLNNSVNKLIKLIQFLYTFSIHIEENLGLIKEIFNENLDKDHFSNYSREDNDRNEEKNIYNDEGEEECEEISSRMFAFIPTYNTPRSSIN
ncbi:25630_t:CDS:2, partial [Dentiscutata erythropus]